MNYVVENNIGAWSNGTVAKSICCFCTSPESNSQSPYSWLTAASILVLGYLVPPSELCSYQHACANTCTHTHMHTLTHKETCQGMFLLESQRESCGLFCLGKNKDSMDCCL